MFDQKTNEANMKKITLLVFLAFFESIAIAQTPTFTTTQQGTVMPVQCLACIGVRDVQLWDPAVGYREPVAGDFVTLADFSAVPALLRLTGPNGVFFQQSTVRLADLGQNPLVLKDSTNQSSWNRFGLVGESSYSGGTTNTYIAGLTVKNQQPWSSIIRQNSVCKGPVIRIAKQLLLGGDGRPAAPYNNVSGIFTEGAPGSVSSEAGLSNIANSHQLLCIGETVDADDYYKSLVDVQLKEMARDLASRTSVEKMRILMNEVLKSYIAESNQAIVDSTAAKVIDELVKRGAIVNPVVKPKSTSQRVKRVSVNTGK
ncbi:hypothetical protein [Undibacterium umbellatum]|uniref:Uncharacterized protein n=1 Tax=Undibacterium umbellatum TaxID=2762300 RepID=A0ABR6ZH90_9BURK|nr:hypothetical protein [Undibacterium umbellatum]MBC3910931.1 hypothetical protein [Undibacterium umbellatum]